MTQEKLIKEFISGAVEGNNDGKHNLVIREGRLFHYYTVIAEHYDERIIVNMTRYSLVTGRIQKMLKTFIPAEKLIRVTNVPEGTRSSLKEYILN